MKVKTHFATALKSTNEEILNEHEFVVSQKLFREIFGAMTGISAIINKHRQIIYGNNDFLAFLGIKTLEPVLGKRPGEALACIHSVEETAGCGTSAACAYCGVVNAFLESQISGLRSVKETRLTTNDEGKLRSWDLKIISTPITLSENQFYVVTFQDISDEKRRSSLERIFFHDLLNSAGGLNGLLSILKDGTNPEEERNLINLSEEASRDIIEEIMLHKNLRDAENGDLHVKIEHANSIDLLESVLGKIAFHEIGKNRRLLIAEHSANIDFETDKILFQRIIINLLKNALESTTDEGLVTAGIENKGDKLRFWVKNEEVIPKDVQMQLFQRSFSTKGHNRGIGTYSIRLLTENYLKGKVSFISNKRDGTIFSVELNKIWNTN